jgi:hypothetical protein
MAYNLTYICIYFRVDIKKSTEKNPPKKIHLKKPTKNVWFLVLKFFIFYENNTNFSFSNRFL